MPSGLINIGATYQMMVIKLLSSMIILTMDAYIYDMLVKSV